MLESKHVKSAEPLGRMLIDYVWDLAVSKLAMIDTMVLVHSHAAQALKILLEKMRPRTLCALPRVRRV